jgi:hypothetical protein
LQDLIEPEPYLGSDPERAALTIHGPSVIAHLNDASLSSFRFSVWMLATMVSVSEDISLYQEPPAWDSSYGQTVGLCEFTLISDDSSHSSSSDGESPLFRISEDRVDFFISRGEAVRAYSILAEAKQRLTRQDTVEVFKGLEIVLLRAAG